MPYSDARCTTRTPIASPHQPPPSETSSNLMPCMVPPPVNVSFFWVTQACAAFPHFHSLVKAYAAPPVTEVVFWEAFNAHARPSVNVGAECAPRELVVATDAALEQLKFFLATRDDKGRRSKKDQFQVRTPQPHFVLPPTIHEPHQVLRIVNEMKCSTLHKMHC